MIKHHEILDCEEYLEAIDCHQKLEFFGDNLQWKYSIVPHGCLSKEENLEYFKYFDFRVKNVRS